MSLLLPMVLLGATALRAGEMVGTITGKSDAMPVPGVGLVDLSTGQNTISRAEGTYRLKNLATGKHSIKVVSLGFVTDTVEVEIEYASQVVRRDLVLEPVEQVESAVVVTGRCMMESESAARYTEQTSPTVVSVLSAEAIGRSTDISTAEAIQRIPGVSVTRVRGEARTAIIRGMEARYNNLLVDGLRIPSPSTNTRVVNMDFLPSDLLQRIEVVKVLTPDMEADAIGGAVNIITREAPMKSVFRARVGTGYSSMMLNHDYVSFRTDSILDDPLERYGRGYLVKPEDFTRDNAYLLKSTAPPDMMGEITAGTRLMEGRLGLLLGASVQRKYQLSETVRNYEALDADNNPYFTHREYRLHSHSKTRTGLNLKADYILGHDNVISASAVAFLRRNRESRILSDTNITFAPILYTKERSVYQKHNVITTALSGKHGAGLLGLKWRFGWSYADQNKPDRAEIVTSNALIGDSIVSERYFHDYDHDWQHNTDEDLQGGMDISWGDEDRQGFKVTTGGLFRLKNRDNYMNAYRLIPIPDSAGNIPRYNGLEQLQWQVANIGGTPEYANNNYVASEDVYAGYAMGEIALNRWRILGGVRVEGTNAAYSTNDVNLLRTLTGETSYLDVLPSIHLRYLLNSSSNLRLSVGRSISRPEFFDLVPYNYVGGDLRERGNPDLKRTLSTNIDLRYEHFPDAVDSRQLSVGFFFKRIEDPVETTLDLSNPSLPTLIPRNLGTATNFGVELIGAIQLVDLFSLYANYTFTESSITSDKIRFNKEAGATETFQETRSLQGQSQHVANLGVTFKDTAIGTMAQLSFIFTGSRVARVSPFLGLDHLQTDFPILDLSAEQRLSRYFSLFLHLTNLLNSPYEIRLANDMLIEKETFGQRLNMGLTARFQ